MAKKQKPADPKRDALNRLLASVGTQAVTLALTKAPKAERILAFVALLRQTADEAEALAGES